MKISEENWHRLLDLLDSYLELPERDRDQFLASTSAASAELGASLRQLIRDYDAGELLSAHAIVAPGSPRQAQPLSRGRLVGRYTLVKAIGRGAMSAVWLAERRNASSKGQVALKFPYSSLSTVHDRDKVAALNHPGIARFIESGTTEDKQPWLAVEYVEGMPLLKFAARERLGIEQRVLLFLEVLKALGHGHSQLATHRNIKPSNILIDAAGRAHLVDYGILSYPLGKSDYASPEEILGEPLGTASDVYSAAAVLFELLTGQRPYRLKSGGDYSRADAILAVQTPSLAGAVAPGHAESCGIPPSALPRRLRGDLNSVVQKALHKDPAERYASADAFAQDLVRSLRREPVMAQPTTQFYRARQFLRRRPLLAVSGACLVLCLCLALIVAYGKSRAARLEAQRAAAVESFISSLFVNPAHSDHVNAADLLDAGMNRVHEGLDQEPEAEIRVLGALAGMYYELDQPEGGARAEAERLALMKSLYGVHDPRVVESLIDYAAHLNFSARHAQALEPLEEAKLALDARGEGRSPLRGRLLLETSRIFRQSAVSDSRNYADQAVEILTSQDPDDRLIEALREAAQARRMLEDYSGARESLIRATAMVELRHAGSERWQLEPLCELAVLQSDLQAIEDAEAKFRACIAQARRLGGAESLGTRRKEMAFARFLQDTSRSDEARQWFTAATGDSNDFLIEGDVLQFLLADGRADAAAALLARYLPQVRRRYPDSQLLARALLAGARLAELEGRFADAEAQLAEGLMALRKSLGANAEPTAENDFALAQARLALTRGDAGAAMHAIERVRNARNAAAATPGPERFEAQVLHAHALLLMDRPEEALAESAAMLEAVRRSPLHAFLQRLDADASLVMARAQIQAGRFLDSQMQAERALSLRQALEDPKSLDIAEAQVVLARSLIGQRQFPIAQRLLIDAAAIITARQPGPQFSGPLKSAGDELNRALHPPKPALKAKRAK